MKISVLPLIVLLGCSTTSNGMAPYGHKKDTITFCIIDKNGNERLTTIYLGPSEKGGKFDDDIIRGPLLVLAALNGNSRRVQEILAGLSDEKRNEIIKNEFKDDIYLPAQEIGLRFSGDLRPYEETALMCATGNGNIDIIEKLLAFRTNINAQCDIYLFTPLICATGNGQLEAVRLLVQKNANLKLRDCAQITALDHARAMHRYEIIKLLEEAELKEAKNELADDCWQQKYAEQESLPD